MAVRFSFNKSLGLTPYKSRYCYEKVTADMAEVAYYQYLEFWPYFLIF
jgi:hypothetical protein